MTNHTNSASCFQVQCFLSKLSQAEANAGDVFQQKALPSLSAFGASSWESVLANSVALSEERLCILLTYFNIVTKDCIEDVKAIAFQESQTLEEALILTGWVTRKQLNDVCAIAEMLERHAIDWSIATAAMTFLTSSNQTVYEAVARARKRQQLRQKSKTPLPSCI